MSRDEIIRALDWHTQTVEAGPQSLLRRIESLVAQAEAAEREACAKVCDKWHRIAQQYENSHRTHSYIMGKGAAICAHNIRARGQL